MANVNNRYVWTAEEVKLFLALIEEKNIAAILDGKKHNSTVYTTSPGMCVRVRSNQTFYFLKIRFTF